MMQFTSLFAACYVLVNSIPVVLPTVLWLHYSIVMFMNDFC